MEGNSFMISECPLCGEQWLKQSLGQVHEGCRGAVAESESQSRRADHENTTDNHILGRRLVLPKF